MAMKRLNDRDVFPTDEVLQDALGRRYAAYQALISSLTSPEYGLTAEWRYYIDGKWLCKVCHKKKTIFWLSIWDKFIQITFYLMERHRDGISELAIDETLKSEFYQSEPVGTHLPLVIRVTKKKQIQDVLAITRYKKSLK
jgi:hypothetical protein